MSLIEMDWHPGRTQLRVFGLSALVASVVLAGVIVLLCAGGRLGHRGRGGWDGDSALHSGLASCGTYHLHRPDSPWGCPSDSS